jgi:Na+/H+-translocating membrane pyrophosphatase
MKVQETVKKETMHIAVGTLLLTAVMLLVFLVLGRLDQPVVLGAVLGSGFAILNFFVLGLSVQKSVATGNATRGKLMMTLSYSLRMLVMMGVVVLGLALPYFSWVTVVLPQLFPRLTIAGMQMLGMYKPEKKGEDEAAEEGERAE